MKKTDRAALSAEKISKLTGNGVKVFVFDTVDSTNNEAKRMLESGFRGKALVAAKAQTGGRGRLGRSFYSPASTGLYMTLIIPPVFPMEHIPLITPAAAVAVTRALGGITEKELFIKWVNDIYCGGKKVCGILAEAVADQDGGFAGFAVGIGINLSTRDFPDGLENIAASLDVCEADTNALAAGIANELFSLCQNLGGREFLCEYRARSYVTGKDIYFIKDGERTDAHVLGIDDDGGLIVRTAEGEQVLRGGEISVRIY